MVKENTVSDAREPLDVVFERHRGRLLAAVRGRINPRLTVRVDDEDVLQIAFYKALERWDRFQPQGDDPDAACFAWLREIVIHCLFDEWDRHGVNQGRSVTHEVPMADGSSACEKLGLVSPETGPRTEAERNEQERQLHELMGRLKSADQEILRMIDFEGRSYAEVAELLAINEGAARARHMKALRRLKKLWKETYPADGVN